MDSIHNFVRNRGPLIVKENVNRPNIYIWSVNINNYHRKLRDMIFLFFFAARVAEKIKNHCTIIYTDFINSVGPIVSELLELGS